MTTPNPASTTAQAPAANSAPANASAEPGFLPDHRFAKPERQYKFFAAPPTEIGQLVTGESSEYEGKMSKWMTRPLIGLLIAGCVSGLLLAAAADPNNQPQAASLRLGAYISGAVIMIVALLSARYKSIITYVGDRGVVRYKFKGGPTATPKMELLIFEQAAELHASQTRHFVNGIYTGTDYKYYWNDPTGKKIFRLGGRYLGKKKPPKNGSPFHFARAAELAWSNYYLAHADQQLKTEGSILFRVDNKRAVRVGHGFLEFHFGGDPVRVTKEEIAKVTLGGGTFRFTHKDAKWLSSAGKYSFQYGTMANARVFLLALEKLMGYRWN